MRLLRGAGRLPWQAGIVAQTAVLRAQGGVGCIALHVAICRENERFRPGNGCFIGRPFEANGHIHPDEAALCEIGQQGFKGTGLRAGQQSQP